MLIGNLGADPEVRMTPSGVQVATLSIATTTTWKDPNGNIQEKTEWHRVILWRGLADVAQRYLKKGNQIYIEGKLQTRNWNDNEGQKRYVTEVVGDQMIMLGSAGGSGQTYTEDIPAPSDQDIRTNSNPSAQVNQMGDRSGDAQPGFDETDDDLPF